MLASLFKLRHASLSLQMSLELLGCLPLLLFFVDDTVVDVVGAVPRWLLDGFDVILHSFYLFEDFEHLKSIFSGVIA